MWSMFEQVVVYFQRKTAKCPQFTQKSFHHHAQQLQLTCFHGAVVQGAPAVRIQAPQDDLASSVLVRGVFATQPLEFRGKGKSGASSTKGVLYAGMNKTLLGLCVWCPFKVLGIRTENTRNLCALAQTGRGARQTWSWHRD